ncbi:trigger factor [Pelotomaculum isophthalicicum JI]|uniref:Trigger factor n=1 Tax=Pelotomaculum isophthalicicum JI TaxID=947010 RepID=A0A9X4H594_9FIRM|nr:trigger factor [Pelotomaculum isophthalicicum]MDF9408282.1 trigger factor [Pelotomaculum isophthalicicum JI]
MKANAERIEKNTVLLEVEVDAELFSQAVNKAYRNIVKKVNIPGFRKGKTPRHILERYIGKEALYEEAMEALVPEAYFDAVKDTGIEPVDKPQVEIVQAEEGKPVVFKATVIVKPEVELGQYKELEVVKQSYKIEDEDIQKELDRLQNSHAKLLTMEEGTVEKDDIAVIDFLGKTNGEPFKGGEGKDYSLEIGSGSFIEGFEDQIIGMTINETRDIQVTFPNSYQSEELAGKEATFTVTVKEIKRKELAPLDDEFAKDVSEFDTLQELKDDIKNKLIQAAESRAKFMLRRELLDKAVDNAVAEIPDSMIEQQTREMFKNIGDNFARQGLSVEDYLNYNKSSIEKMKEDMRPEAERNVKTSLVMESIGKAEGITATEEEIQAEIEKIASAYRQDPEEFRKTIESEGSLDFIKDNIVKEKTFQFLVDNAKIIEDTNVETAE